MRVFEICIRVAADNLTTVIDVLKDSADLVSMLQVEDGTPKPRQKRPKGGMTSRELIVSSVAERPMTTHSMIKIFESKGFSPNSFGPAVNELIRAGKVKKIADGVWGAA